MKTDLVVPQGNYTIQFATNERTNIAFIYDSEKALMATLDTAVYVKMLIDEVKRLRQLVGNMLPPD